MRIILPALLLTALTCAPALAETDFGRFSVEQELPVLNVEEAISQSPQIEDATILLTGDITSVCTNSGCWALFQADDQFIRVQARDHSFSLPEDLRGQAIAEGVFKREAITGESRKGHYESDESDSQDRQLADANSLYEYRLVADGLRLVD